MNMISVYAAAQKAVAEWKSLTNLPIRPTFIYTGNCCNVIPLSGLMDLTVGKAGSASIIAMAAKAYEENKFRYVVASYAPGATTKAKYGVSQVLLR